MASESVVALIQILFGLLFSAVGIYFPLFKGAPAWLFIFLLIGLAALFNGVRNLKSGNFPAWSIGIPLSLLFFFAAYLTLTSNTAASFTLKSLGPVDMIFGKPEISNSASKYTLFAGFVIAGLWPLISKLFLTKGTSFWRIYGLASFIFPIFPTAYMIILERNTGSMPLIYLWIVVTLVFYLQTKLRQDDRLNV